MDKFLYTGRPLHEDVRTRRSADTRLCPRTSKKEREAGRRPEGPRAGERDEEEHRESVLGLDRVRVEEGLYLFVSS